MKIFCVGRNYAEHARELNNDVPEEPIIFLKPKSALIQPHAHFYYPEFSNELNYEAELVLRVSKNGKYIPEYAASRYFNAITVGIDFTARDVQTELKKKGLPWEKAKSWDNSAVIGDWIDLTPTLLKNPIHFSLQLNGDTVQTGIHTDMIFSFEKIVSNISQYFSLNIGDLIFTGTPEGVGECVVGDNLEGYFGKTKVFSVMVK
jgi:2-keto-4-pentenoate hydratase/2-oxohepta-3-ene-1,7-dioic acid hydratase in catechol pathway